MKILDVGCGKKKIKGAIGIDIADADILHNLNETPYPLKSNSFDRIYSRHCLEHLNEFTQTVIELHRITKKNGILEIIVPFYASAGAHLPTHKLFFNYNSFDLFSESNDRWDITKNKLFEIVERKYSFHPKAVETKYTLPSKIVFFIPELLANSFPLLYQKIFANILPAYEIRFILRVIK